MSWLPHIRNAFLALTLISCAMVSESVAQVVQGTVVDESGLAIPGVNILITGTDSGTAADVQGRYRLPLPGAGTYVLRFSSIGFHEIQQTIRVGPSQEITLDIELRERVLLGDEIIVTASRREQAALSVPVSVSVLSAEDLTRRNTVVLDDALRSVSGVTVLGNQINVRGSSGFAYNTGSRVLLMLDGMPLLTPDSDGVPLEALPASEIEQIEVLKGPGSALYGSGALGGVINVITRKMPDKPETSIRSFAGVWDPVRHKVWRDGWKHGNEYRPFWGLTASHARRSSAKFAWWTSVSFRRDAGYLALSGRDVFHGFAKMSWQPSSSWRLETLVGIMARQRDNFIFWESARNVLTPGRASFGDAPADPGSSPNGAPDDFVRQISLLPILTHFVNSTFYYEVRLRGFGTLVQPISDETGQRKKLSEGTVGARYGGEFQANWIPSERRRFVGGFSRDAITTQSSFFVTNDGDELGGQPEIAAFLHAEERLTPDLELVLGARYDHYRIDARDTEQRVSPKVSLAWTGWKGKTLRFAWGDGFRVPSFAERFTDNRDYLPIVRNLELRPERSRSLEVGFRGISKAIIPGIVSWDVSVFRNTYEGFIEPRLVPAEQAFQFINLPQARIIGAESMLEWQSDGGMLHLSMGYTWLHTEETESGEELPFRPSHQVVSTIEVAATPSVRVGMDGRWISEPGRLETDFARFVTDADMMVDTRVVDFRTSAQRGPFTFALIVNNVLEYHYVDRPAILGEPRRFTIQATWKR